MKKYGNLNFDDFFKHIEKKDYKGSKKTINLGQGNPKVELPVKVIYKFFDFLKNDESHHYPNNMYINILKKHIKKIYKNKYLADISVENIGIFNGAKKILHLLFNSILNSNSHVLLIDPAYPDYERILNNVSENIIKLPVYKGLPNTDEIENLVKQHSIELIIFNYPNNPTGEISTENFWKKIHYISMKYNVFIINDYTYSDYVYNGYSSPSLLKGSDSNNKIIEIYSFSKNYTIPGWRIASVIANENVINDITTKNNLMETGIFNPIVQSLNYILSNYNNSFVDTHFYQQNMKYLKNKLSVFTDWKINAPPSGMFLWIYIKDTCSWDYFLYLLNEKNIIVLPGILYGYKYKNYIRISLNTNYNEIDDLISRLKE